eukprot:XP_012824397.1 PREDICTED: N-acylethanolamine-hydrolyzing acid amidase-like [Xenopus tropicalis]
MNSTGQKNISMDSLYQILSMPPVLNRMTIHTTLMRAAFPGNYTTVLRSKVFNKNELWKKPRTMENTTQDSSVEDTEND